MRFIRILLLMLLMTCGNNTIFSQQKSDLLSLEFNNLDIEEVLTRIEEKYDMQFYYQDSWFDNFPKITKSYNNKTTEFILKDLLNDSKLNFYVYNKKSVILTENTIIYDELPDGFLQDSETVIESSKQVFFTNNINSSYRSFFIGKSDKSISANQKAPVTIKLINKKTREPFTGVNVIINDLNFGTNEKGIVNINLTPGKYQMELKSSFIENEIINLTVYGSGNIIIAANEYIQQLKEVIVDASAKQVIKEAITKTTFNVAASKNIPLVLGERDLLKVSTTLPGISSVGEGAVGYNVRGGKTDQNLIFLDKAVIYNPQHFFGLFSGLNPFAISDVTIYKSGIPSHFGGRLSSVFELETKNADLKEFKGEASLGPVTGNVMLETPIVKEKAGLLVGGRSAYADWILQQIDNESIKNSKASFYDVVAKYNHKLSEKANIEATGYLSSDNFNVTKDSLYNYSNKLVSIRYNQKINSKHKFNMSLSNTDYSFAIEFDGPSNNDFELGFRANETNGKALFEYTYSPKLKFEYGIASKLYNINPGQKDPLNSDSNIAPVNIDNEKALESALFISSNIDITDKFNIDAGFRYSFFNGLGPSNQFIYDDNSPKSDASIIGNRSFGKYEISKTYTNPELRIAMRYALNNTLSIKTSYGRMAQYLHTLSNNTTASPVDIWKLSDINIKPQTSDQFTLGVFKNIDAGLYQLSLEGFYKLSNNALEFKTGSQILLNENIEQDVLQGEGKAYGLEFLLKKQLGKLNGWLSYTYSRSLIKLESEFEEETINGGEFFPTNYDRPHNLNFIGNYKFTKRYSVSTNFSYQTGRPVTFPVGTFNFGNSEFTTFSDRNEFRIPDYYRLDIGFNIEGNHKVKKVGHSFWTISVYNVLGRNNPFSVFFITEEGSVKAFQSSVFSVPVPSITYNFKF